MGGGDLNLKKSWHPQTLRNVERVWKAEQKADAEAKKIEQLRKELEEERAREEMQRHAVHQGIAKKKSERLDWMYAAAAGSVDHEMYLLGKPVDKAVDPMAQENEEDSTAPGASFMNDTGANTPNDLAAKVRDDPLFMIKKKEEEKRKELLNNPVKMKQLKQMLQANLDKSKKKKKDKKKKKEREKERDGKTKRKERRAERSDESEEDEREMAKENKKKRNERHRKRSEEWEEDHRKMGKEEKRRRNERHRESSEESEDERERGRENRKRHEERNGLQRNRVEEDERRGSHYRNGEHHSYRHRSPERRRPQMRSRSKSPAPRRERERRDDRRHRRHSSSSPAKDRRHRSRSPVKRKSRSPSHSPPRKSRKSPSPDREKTWKKGGSAVTKHMDDAEREKRLAAMMDNAKWRDEQRGKNVKRYREEDAKLEANEVVNKDKSATFLKDMKLQSFSSKTTSNVGDRIKRNINSVQRTPAALESFLGK